nr:MAG TPA: hypothetical protein [Caudoviricetes sp.]
MPPPHANRLNDNNVIKSIVNIFFISIPSLDTNIIAQELVKMYNFLFYDINRDKICLYMGGG